MKKLLAMLMSFLFIVISVPVSAYGANEKTKTVIELKSNIASCTYEDYEKFALIKSDDVVFDESQRSDPVLVTDYAGTPYFDKIKAGRTYYIYYTLYAAEEFEIPDKYNEDNIEFICDKGCEVFWYGTTVGTGKDGEKIKSLSVWTKVKVDGNFLQNLFGKIADIYLKITAWSPY